METTKVAHTPGPWKLERSDDDSICEIIGGNGLMVTSLVNDRGEKYGDEYDFEGNAKLIAAAPTLVESCNTAIDELGYTDEFDADQLRQIIDDACEILRGALRTAGKLT